MRTGLRLLEGDELVAAFDRAVGPELSLEEKLLIFDSVGEAEPQKTLARARRRALCGDSRRTCGGIQYGAVHLRP